MKKNVNYYLFMLFSFSLCLNINVSGQIDSFKLSDYKLPDLKRQGIDLQFNLNSVSSNNDYQDTIGVDNNRNYFSNTFNAAYFLYLNKEKYQGNHSIQINNKYSLTSYKLDDNSHKRWVSNIVNMNYNSTNRIYFKNLFYFGISIFGSSSFSYITLDNVSYLNNRKNLYEYQKVNSNSYDVNLPLSFGKGRIEHIEDARHAIYILDELKKNNRLKHEPSKVEILEFAKRISEIKNKRILDSRNKNIYELNQIDSILNKMDLLEKNDIVYFSKLNDMWNFGGIPIRGSGYRLAINYTPIYLFSKRVENHENYDYIGKIGNQFENNFNTKNLKNKVSISFEWEKPIRLKLQNSLNTSIDYIYSDDVSIYDFLGTSYSKNQTDENSISSHIIYSLGLYPNTRTQIVLSTLIFGSKYWTTVRYENSANTEFESYSFGSNISFSIRYYFSPKLSLNLFFSINYDRNNKRENNGNVLTSNYNNLNFSILYSIF